MPWPLVQDTTWTWLRSSDSENMLPMIESTLSASAWSLLFKTTSAPFWINDSYSCVLSSSAL